MKKIKPVNVVTQVQVCSRLLAPIISFLQEDSKELLVNRWTESIRYYRGSTFVRVPIWTWNNYLSVETSLEELVLLIRLCSIPRIFDIFIKIRDRITVEDSPKLNGIYQAFDEFGEINHQVIADYLISQGDWFGEPLSQWLNRPKRVSRYKWGMEVAKNFILKCPSDSDEYVLRGNIHHSSKKEWELIKVYVQEECQPLTSRDLCKVINNFCRTNFGHDCYFSILFEDDSWRIEIPTQSEETGKALCYRKFWLPFPTK